MIKQIMLFAAACAALVACTKDKVQEETGFFKKGQQLTLSVSSMDQTKVVGSLDGNDLNFTWQKNDQILVTVPGCDTPAVFTLVGDGGSAEGQFTGTMPADGTTFSVKYPADDPNLSEQNYEANGVPENKMRFAKDNCTTAGFALEPQDAVIRFDLYGTDKTVGKIVVTNTTASPNIAYTLNMPENGIALPSTKDDAKPFFVVMPAGTYKFKAEVFDTSSQLIRAYETSEAKEFAVGQFLDMPSKEVKKIELPEGALSGVFSVSANTKVYFSKGNMYCNTSTNPVTYSFESLQCDYRHYQGVSGDKAVINGTITTTTTGTVGSFWWVKNTEKSVIPYSQTCGSFSPSNVSGDIFFTNATADTPNANFTCNGQSELWRTLSNTEWTYLLNTSGNPSEARTQTNRFAKAKLKGVNGLIVFPDGYNGSTEVSGVTGIANVNTTNAAYPETSISNDIWTAMELAGCVFLPAAGYRGVGDNTPYADYYDKQGEYCCSTSTSNGWDLKFTSTTVTPYSFNRKNARSVRLVTDVK